jgi:hypothetical protein
VRFGWSVLTLRAEDDGLRVCEPLDHSVKSVTSWAKTSTILDSQLNSKRFKR